MRDDRRSEDMPIFGVVGHTRDERI
jgi:hypothetical protein